MSIDVITDVSDLAPNAAGDTSEIVALVDPGALSLDELVVQAVHGPLLADGSFDESSMVTETMHHGDGGTYRGTITPSGAGPWGVTVRAIPTHPGLSSIYDTGLVAAG